MAFQSTVMELNKREGPEGNRKFAKLGEVNIHVPLLKDVLAFIASAEISKDDKGVEQYEDGVPVYVSDEANWVQGAIYAQVKAQARNKIVSGTANLKPDQKIAETWEELCAEGERGQGAGLAIARECKAKFSDFVKTLGLSEAAMVSLVSLFSNKNNLALQPQSIKDKVAARVEAFAETLEPPEAERFMRPLQGIVDATKPIAADALDF